MPFTATRARSRLSSGNGAKKKGLQFALPETGAVKFSFETPKEGAEVEGDAVDLDFQLVFPRDSRDLPSSAVVLSSLRCPRVPESGAEKRASDTSCVGSIAVPMLR